MSAWIVEREHIAVLVNGLSDAIARGRTPWRDYTGGDSGDPKASEGGYSALVGAVEKAAAEVVSGEAR